MPSSVESAVREPRLAALVLVTGVGPFATDTYVAALPDVEKSLHTSATIAQLTVTAFIIGLAVGQLVFGPISDGLGRRRLLLYGTVGFTACSVLCALAPTGWVLLVARVGQGIAGGCGVAIGRAVVSDRFSGDAAATRFGTLTAVTLLGPVVAPAVGGVILSFADWRAIFVFLTALGVAMVAAVWFGLPETLPAQKRHQHGLTHSLQRMRGLLKSRPFLAPVVVQCLATAGFFVYIGGSSIVLQGELGLSATRYAALFATNAAAMACASLTFRLTVVRFGPRALRLAGLSISTLSALALLAYSLSVSDVALAPTWVLLAGMVAGNGLSIPATTTLAQEAGRGTGGTASALQGGLTFVIGALATPLTGATGQQTVLGMAALSTVLYSAAVVGLAFFARASAGRP